MSKPDLDAIRCARKSDRDQIASLALGRLLRLGSRPSQPGDHEAFDELRAVIMAATEADRT